MAPPTIDARDLVKRYRRAVALDGLDLTMEQGQILALLGPNGAGKTTFVRAVATLLRGYGGTLTVAGYDAAREAAKVRRIIGLAGQFASVEGAMTGRENLELVARLYGRSARDARASATRVLADFTLTEAADRLVRTYSGGMRRKLDLGVSMVGAPRLLLLDEPTTGLDPRARLDLWDSIERLVDQGTDVLLTTQYLDEAERLAGRLVIIDRGRTVAEGTAAELKQKVGGTVLQVRVNGQAGLQQVAAVLAGPDREPVVDAGAHLVTVRVGAREQARALMEAARAIELSGVEVSEISVRQPTLDEVFLALTDQRAAVHGEHVKGVQR